MREGEWHIRASRHPKDSLEHPDLLLAYLDPMSGSLILQALIAGVLGGIVTMKRAGMTLREAVSRVWKRIKG